MTSSPVSSTCTPPGQVPLGAVGGEEPGDLGEDVVEVAGLAAAGGGEGVAVHRVARPHDRVAGVARPPRSSGGRRSADAARRPCG